MTQPETWTEPQAPLSVRIVDRAAGFLEGRHATRRRFLARLAVIGSALALAPLRYILRPTPAYASVCGSGNTCGSGWTVFCCTINDGGRAFCLYIVIGDAQDAHLLARRAEQILARLEIEAR